MSIWGAGKEGGGFEMLEHTVEPSLCRGPNLTKWQLLRGCPLDDPVDLLYSYIHMQIRIEDKMR